MYCTWLYLTAVLTASSMGLITNNDQSNDLKATSKSGKPTQNDGATKKLLPKMRVIAPNATAVRIGSDDGGWIQLKKMEDKTWVAELNHLTPDKNYWTYLAVVNEGQESRKRIDFKATPDCVIDSNEKVVQQVGNWSTRTTLSGSC